MNENAREIFRRIVGGSPMVWDPGAATPRERTDAELDALVAYAIRADAACEREAKRYAAANPVPRPMPTGVPPGPMRETAATIIDRLIGGARR